MTLVEDINNKFRKTYSVTARCSNCSHVQDVKVPKGETIRDYFNSERGKCENCGTACLESYKKPFIPGFSIPNPECFPQRIKVWGEPSRRVYTEEDIRRKKLKRR